MLTTVICNSEIQVPPSQSVQYSLIFISDNATINAYTDFKQNFTFRIVESTKVNLRNDCYEEQKLAMVVQPRKGAK